MPSGRWLQLTAVTLDFHNVRPDRRVMVCLGATPTRTLTDCWEPSRVQGSLSVACRRGSRSGTAVVSRWAVSVCPRQLLTALTQPVAKLWRVEELDPMYCAQLVERDVEAFHPELELHLSRGL